MKNLEIAERIFEAYVAFATEENGVFLTYSELARRIGRAGQHHFLGAPLDIVSGICDAKGVPNITTVIVDKPSLLGGTVKPSASAIKKYDGWSNLRNEQTRVMLFDWAIA